MEIRTFRAATLQEALEQVRETLGPDAAVLHTRQIKRSRLGLFASSEVEVEASIDLPIRSTATNKASESAAPTNRIKKHASDPQSAAATETSQHVRSEQKNSATSVGDVSIDSSRVSTSPSNDSANAPSAFENSANSNQQAAAFSRIAESAQESTRSPQHHDSHESLHRLPPAMYEALTEMLDAGVEPTEARRLLQTAAEQLSGDQLSDPWLVHGRICQFVGKNLRIADPISVRPTEQSVVAFVGPTGVGKTTTLAKLAATFQHEHKCRVGLLTLDTMRPGAVDQLLQYAESLDAALEVVDTPSQFLPAIARMKNCDIVLVDTAGRSPNDDQQLAVLHDLLEAAQPTSVQLVVSATNSVAHVKATLNKFGSLNPNGLVITKLDEAIGFGSWLSVLQQCTIPISYVGYGQHVPNDLAPANRRRLASLLLGPSSAPAN